MTRRPDLHDELAGTADDRFRRAEGDDADAEWNATSKRRRMPAGWWTVPGILIGATLIVVVLRAVL